MPLPCLLCLLFLLYLLPTNLHRLDRGRANLKCGICRKKGGGCVQCVYGQCLESFHTYCAFTTDPQLQLIRRVNDVGVSSELYCPEHQDKARHDKSVFASTRDFSSTPAPTSTSGKKGHTQTQRSPHNLNSNHNHNPSGHSAPSTPFNLQDTQELFDTDEKRRVSLVGVGSSSGVNGLADMADLGGDSSRRPPVPKRKRLQKGNGGGSNQLELVTKKQKQKQKQKEKEAKKSKEQLLFEKKERRAARRYFDLEAEVSGSDSGDEHKKGGGGGGEDSQGEHKGSQGSTQLSGNFINDGDYTQHSDDEGVEDDNLLYYQVNHLEHGRGSSRSRSRSSGEKDGYVMGGGGGMSAYSPSPLKFGFRGGENGLPMLERLMEKARDKEKRKEEKARGIGKGSKRGLGANGDGGADADDDENERSRNKAKREKRKQHRRRSAGGLPRPHEEYFLKGGLNEPKFYGKGTEQEEDEDAEAEFGDGHEQKKSISGGGGGSGSMSGSIEVIDLSSEDPALALNQPSPKLQQVHASAASISSISANTPTQTQASVQSPHDPNSHDFNYNHSNKQGRTHSPHTAGYGGFNNSDSDDDEEEVVSPTPAHHKPKESKGSRAVVGAGARLLAYSASALSQIDSTDADW